MKTYEKPFRCPRCNRKHTSVDGYDLCDYCKGIKKPRISKKRQEKLNKIRNTIEKLLDK